MHSLLDLSSWQERGIPASCTSHFFPYTGICNNGALVLVVRIKYVFGQNKPLAGIIPLLVVQEVEYMINHRTSCAAALIDYQHVSQSLRHLTTSSPQPFTHPTDTGPGLVTCV